MAVSVEVRFQCAVLYVTTYLAPAVKIGQSVVLYAVLALFAAASHAATKVAFIADQGVGSNAQAVLSLIRNEGADLLLIQGDLGYDDNQAAQWEANLTEILGRDFPVVTVAGNHENFEWPLYKQFIKQRIDRSSGLKCEGDVGVKSSCIYANVQVVQVSPNIYEVPGIKAVDGYAEFIRESFNQSDATWRICSWHKNQYSLQVHSKDSQVDWDLFDACLNAGAMVVMGHAHTYSRTYMLSDFQSQTVVNRSDEMQLGPGRSFAVVSGLGGRSIKPQSNSGEWFASVYTATQGASHGALFCSMGSNEADCYFKSINGSIPDRFRLQSTYTDNTLPANDDLLPQENLPNGLADNSSLTEPAVFSRTDKPEIRWLARNSAGQWGSRWIDEACAERLGGPTLFGDWTELLSLAPATDTVASPCSVADDSVPTPPPPPPPPPLQPDTEDGFVFSRTDKTEFRWIATNSNSQLGSIWIDARCADDLGGPSITGDWGDLMALAPGFDTLRSPCNSAGGMPDIDTGNGYVFSRTDKIEYRWIDVNSSGQVGSIWIDQACAETLGGVSMTGDWKKLIELAPGFDTISSPCY